MTMRISVHCSKEVLSGAIDVPLKRTGVRGVTIIFCALPENPRMAQVFVQGDQKFLQDLHTCAESGSPFSLHITEED